MPAIDSAKFFGISSTSEYAQSSQSARFVQGQTYHPVSRGFAGWKVSADFARANSLTFEQWAEAHHSNRKQIRAAAVGGLAAIGQNPCITSNRYHKQQDAEL
jgi:hypothetical protein